MTTDWCAVAQESPNVVLRDVSNQTQLSTGNGRVVAVYVAISIRRVGRSNERTMKDRVRTCTVAPRCNTCESCQGFLRVDAIGYPTI